MSGIRTPSPPTPRRGDPAPAHQRWHSPEPFPGEAAPWPAEAQTPEAQLVADLQERARILSGGGAAGIATPVASCTSPFHTQRRSLRIVGSEDDIHRSDLLLGSQSWNASNPFHSARAREQAEAAERMSPSVPEPHVGDSGNVWGAIDHVSIEACFVSPFAHLDDIPHAHSEAWAHALGDVLRLWEEACDEEEETRALKWILVLHDLLLRLPPRGGRRGRAQVAHRFQAWVEGDLTTVVKWWEQDRGAARHPFSKAANSDRTLQRACSSSERVNSAGPQDCCTALDSAT